MQAASPIAEHGAVNEVRIILPLVGLGVTTTVVHGHAEAHDVHAGLGAAQLGVTGQIAADDHSINAHFYLFSW